MILNLIKLTNDLIFRVVFSCVYTVSEVETVVPYTHNLICGNLQRSHCNKTTYLSSYYDYPFLYTSTCLTWAKYP